MNPEGITLSEKKEIIEDNMYFSYPFVTSKISYTVL
jgi:hypothetical protein